MSNLNQTRLVIFLFILSVVTTACASQVAPQAYEQCIEKGYSQAECKDQNHFFYRTYYGTSGGSAAPTRVSGSKSKSVRTGINKAPSSTRVGGFGVGRAGGALS